MDEAIRDLAMDAAIPAMVPAVPAMGEAIRVTALAVPAMGLAIRVTAPAARVTAVI
jgi:hypothetical protein